MFMPRRAGPPEAVSPRHERAAPLRHPVFQQQSRDTLEVTQVVGDQGQAATARMTGDVHVVDTDRLSLPL